MWTILALVGLLLLISVISMVFWVILDTSFFEWVGRYRLGTAVAMTTRRFRRTAFVKTTRSIIHWCFVWVWTQTKKLGDYLWKHKATTSLAVFFVGVVATTVMVVYSSTTYFPLIYPFLSLSSNSKEEVVDESPATAEVVNVVQGNLVNNLIMLAVGIVVVLILRKKYLANQKSRVATTTSPTPAVPATTSPPTPANPPRGRFGRVIDSTKPFVPSGTFWKKLLGLFCLIVLIYVIMSLVFTDVWEHTVVPTLEKTKADKPLEFWLIVGLASVLLLAWLFKKPEVVEDKNRVTAKDRWTFFTGTFSAVLKGAITLVIVGAITLLILDATIGLKKDGTWGRPVTNVSQPSSKPVITGTLMPGKESETYNVAGKHIGCETSSGAWIRINDSREFWYEPGMQISAERDLGGAIRTIAFRAPDGGSPITYTITFK